jgi:hypothetical protein
MQVSTIPSTCTFEFSIGLIISNFSNAPPGREIVKGAANEYGESGECGTSVQIAVVNNLDQRKRSHNQSITRLGEMSACIHGMH